MIVKILIILNYSNLTTNFNLLTGTHFFKKKLVNREKLKNCTPFGQQLSRNTPYCENRENHRRIMMGRHLLLIENSEFNNSEKTDTLINFAKYPRSNSQTSYT